MGVPGATLVAESEALLTETVGRETGPCGGAAVRPGMDEPCGSVVLIEFSELVKVKSVALVPVPAGVLTVILPVVPVPAMAVICVFELTVKLVAALPPNKTEVASVKLVPVIITLVRLPPEVGVNEVMVGVFMMAGDLL